ncbi:MAG TPA: cell division protein ZapE [Steroidobacteraceae bacterium]|nr:cell division protein ZapE [Steroidobacteraceae bacterium]
MRERAASGLPELYQRELRARGWREDPAQLAAVARLEQLRSEFRARQSGLGVFGRLRRRLWLRGAPEAVRGVYLWGGVGRGKTWLMDLFYESLGGGARRMHFHQLMRELHAALASIRQREAPIELIARRMAKRAQLWCLDELQVTDIADAMLLGTLFEGLLRASVTLVFTSNVPPAGLYRDGLQRARFLPAIALLETRLDVLEVDAGTDYRLRQLRRAPIWLDGADPGTPARLAALFAELAGQHGESTRHLAIGGRHVNALRRAGGVAWFSFATLCVGARSAADYAELADRFHTVVVSDIPVLDAAQDDSARRLISLVDEFYDRGVKLVASAAAPPAQLYRGERLAFEFRRTASRLVEMQSEVYLARAHLEPGERRGDERPAGD